jgi:hypothetical protein
MLHTELIATPAARTIRAVVCFRTLGTGKRANDRIRTTKNSAIFIAGLFPQHDFCGQKYKNIAIASYPCLILIKLSRLQ